MKVVYVFQQRDRAMKARERESLTTGPSQKLSISTHRRNCMCFDPSNQQKNAQKSQENVENMRHFRQRQEIPKHCMFLFLFLVNDIAKNKYATGNNTTLNRRYRHHMFLKKRPENGFSRQKPNITEVRIRNQRLIFASPPSRNSQQMVYVGV